MTTPVQQSGIQIVGRVDGGVQVILPGNRRVVVSFDTTQAGSIDGLTINYRQGGGREIDILGRVDPQTGQYTSASITSVQGGQVVGLTHAERIQAARDADLLLRDETFLRAYPILMGRGPQGRDITDQVISSGQNFADRIRQGYLGPQDRASLSSGPSFA
jgi:hypothetical protein